MRKLRVICSDPDATDCSSDEETSKKTSTKRVVLQMDLQDLNPSPTKKQKTSPYKGVRLRRPGKWASEIRDPVTKSKIWLGTFGSPEEANEAYLAKKAEFESKYSTSISKPTIFESFSSDSEVSKNEEVKTMLEIGSLIIDNNGYLLGEFSRLDDDLRIVCDSEEDN